MASALLPVRTVDLMKKGLRQLAPCKLIIQYTSEP